jgi:hypothetical protein
MIADLDATLLSGHTLPIVRQLATVVAVAAPMRFALALQALATDSDSTVRSLLAHRLFAAQTLVAGTAVVTEEPGVDDEDRRRASREIISEVLEALTNDVWHTVRRAAAGLDS